MIEYPKIETLYNRDPADMKRVTTEVRDPAFALVDRWLVTEKVDGTNVRIGLNANDDMVHFGGRTADAQMPVFLIDRLRDLFPHEKLVAAFDPGVTAVLFGEGYGPKIQKGGGDYASAPGFILFDVAVVAPTRVWWLNWNDVCDVAFKLDIETVPVLGRDVTTAKAEELVAISSSVAHAGTGIDRLQEGIVCRTDPLLFMRNGHRLIWKLKARDFGIRA